MEARPSDRAILAPLEPGPEDLLSLQEPDTGRQLVEPDPLQLDPGMELPLPTVDHDLEALLQDLDPDLPLQPDQDTEPLLLEVQDAVDHQPDQDLEAHQPDLDPGLPLQPDQDTELLLPEDPELPDLDVAAHLHDQDLEARLPDPGSDLLLPQPDLDMELLLPEVQDVVDPLPGPGSERPLQLCPDTELPVHLPDLLPRPATVPQAPRLTLAAPDAAPDPETDPLPLYPDSDPRL